MAEAEMKTISEQKILGLRINQTIKIFLFLIPLFFVPFLFGGPQLLIGTIVNFLLILVALNYKNYYAIVPMVMFPSIAACLNGLVFGSFTIFLVYLMPAIWAANLIFVYTIQHIKTQRLSVLTGGFLKAAFLFLVAYILVHLGILPIIFLKAMGIFQLLTVMIAGVLVFGFTKLSK